MLDQCGALPTGLSRGEGGEFQVLGTEPLEIDKCGGQIRCVDRWQRPMAKAGLGLWQGVVVLTFANILFIYQKGRLFNLQHVTTCSGLAMWERLIVPAATRSGAILP